jgi:hypothetical protein
MDLHAKRIYKKYTFKLLCVYNSPGGVFIPKKLTSKYWHVGELKQIRSVMDVVYKLLEETEHISESLYVLTWIAISKERFG